MSDGQRSSIMDNYLYGGDAAKASADSYSDQLNGTTDDRPRRSKSVDPSRLLEPGTTRTRNIDIEHGVRIKYKSVHNLVEDQQDRVTNEKLKLSELNSRLDALVNAIKSKKAENDSLETEIKAYKEQVLNSSDTTLRKQYTNDLDEAKRDLNDVSEQASLSKIRAARTQYDLETLQSKFDQELKLQTNTREKISYLENQRSESLHEIGNLKDSFESRTKALQDDEEKNQKLRSQLIELGIRLDGELESRVDLECRIQTMIEQRKFEDEINNLMRDELEKLFLYNGKNKLFDPQNFYSNELNQIKERIREDFLKLNEFSNQSLREEYEYKYTKTVEEIEIARKNAEEARLAAENEEMMTINNLKQEHLENEEELKNLRLNGFRLSQTLEELRNRLTDHSAHLQTETERRDMEIAELIDQINNLKIEMSTMLNFSKTLDSEVSVYARLLNERFTQFMTSDTSYEEESSAKFSYDKYKESIFGNVQDEQNELRRKREQEELRKKQLKLEAHQRRLKQLEMEREQERERERKRDREREREKLREIELEEQRKKQREIEEFNRERREHEEHQRWLREQEEVRKQREIEEQRRLFEEQERLAKQREEARKQREIEEQRRLFEEQERLTKQREEEERLRELERRQHEIEMESQRIWDMEQQRLNEVEEKERQAAQDEILRQAAYDHEQRRLKDQDERRRADEQWRADEQRRLEEYELQQHYQEIENQRLEQIRIEEERIRVQQEKERHANQEEILRQTAYELEQERLKREQQRQAEIEEQKKRDREAELKRLEDIIVAEQQRKIYEREQQEEELRRRRQQEIEAEKKRRQDEELDRIVREQEDQIRRQRELEEQLRYNKQMEEIRIRETEEEQRRLKEEQQRQWEIEQIRIREVEETMIMKQRHQLEIEQQNRRAKEQREKELKQQEQERQRRLELEREEREKYILEKLKQEQELLELQKRQQMIAEQREREEYELEYRQRQQELTPQYQHSHREVKCIDNVSTITQRITEEQHKSTEIYEEERVEHLGGSSSPADHVEKQINIKLPGNSEYGQHSHQSSSQNMSEKHQSNVVDHCVSSNNGHKHVLIVNGYKPKPVTHAPVISNVHTVSSRSQSPPKVRQTYISNSSSNDQLSTTNSAPKYAIKHKANRYVSGAIGILETSLNGEYIILENLSSNKNVNLKGWYIHRYVPDQNINLIFKFVNDTMLCCGEKLKILSRSCSTKVRSTSMYEGVNTKSSNVTMTENFKPKDKFVSDGNEKILIASNIENWGTYSKFSVTKLINPDGVDKAVLTQSLLRLASSTSNVNVASPRESSPNTTSLSAKQQSGPNSNSSYYYNRAVSNNNLIRSNGQKNGSSYYEQYSPRSNQHSSETISRTTKMTETTSSSSSHMTTLTSAPYVVETNTLPGNVHVTRQF